VNYVNALQSCITEQMPQVLEDAERLPTEAERVKDRAADQFEALDFMKKAKALQAFAYNMKQLSKVPAVIKAGIEGFKSDLQEVQDAKDQVQTEYASFKLKGAECATAGVKDSVGCYKKVYGPIKYTMEQRTEWEEKMRTILWDKFTKRFDPMQYPLTDLIEGGAKK
jgi:predicted sugar kinase